MDTLPRCKIGLKWAYNKKECKSFTLFFAVLQNVRNFAVLNDLAE